MQAPIQPLNVHLSAAEHGGSQSGDRGVPFIDRSTSPAEMRGLPMSKCMARTCLSLGLVLSFLSLLPGGIASTAQGAGCEPAVHVLPLLPGDTGGRLQAMNDRGWAVGFSYSVVEQQAMSRAVLWRGGDDPIDLGLRGESQEDGAVWHSYGIDVNEDGVVATQQNIARPRDVPTRQVAVLWDDGVASPLPAGNPQNDAVVVDLNDRGTAAGTLTSTRPSGLRRDRAVVWRDGELIRLPVPRGAHGYAAAINNFGLEVGGVTRRGGDSDPWFWRIGGSSGALPIPEAWGPGSLEIDNGDRIVFSKPR